MAARLTFPNTRGCRITRDLPAFGCEPRWFVVGFPVPFLGRRVRAEGHFGRPAEMALPGGVGAYRWPAAGGALRHEQ
jgi:hypothetical protein